MSPNGLERDLSIAKIKIKKERHHYPNSKINLDYCYSILTGMYGIGYIEKLKAATRLLSTSVSIFFFRFRLFFLVVTLDSGFSLECLF